MTKARAAFDASPSTKGVADAGDVKRERPAKLLGRIIFSAALSLVVLATIPYGSVEVWWTSLFEVGVFAVSLLWAIEALLGGGWRVQRQLWLPLPCAALILFSLLQAAHWGGEAAGAGGNPQNLHWHALSADPFETLNFALRLAALTLLGALLLRFTTNRKRLHALVFTVLGVGVASAVFGILRQVTQHEQMGFVLPALPRGIGYGQIISRNQFAFMMEMALGLTLGMLSTRGGGSERALFYLSLALPIVAALILANSRAGIITMMCQLLIFFMLVVPAALARKERAAGWRRQTGALVVRTVSGLALLVAVSAAVVWVGGERVVSNMSTVQEELGAEDTAARWNTRRRDIWRATWEMIKDHPIAGVGFGGYWAAVPQYHDASGEYTPQQAHNDYLELLASGGVLGAAMALWLAVTIARRARRVLAHGDPVRRAACLGALLGLCGVAIHSLFDFGLHLTINAALFVMLVVIATADVQAVSEKRMREGEWTKKV